MKSFLEMVLASHELRNHPSVRGFIEISPLSFIQDIGVKGKESRMIKSPGGFAFNRFWLGFFSCGRLKEGWIALKESCVVVMRKDWSISWVSLFDMASACKVCVYVCVCVCMCVCVCVCVCASNLHLSVEN